MKKALFLKVFRRGQHGPVGCPETYIYIRMGAIGGGPNTKIMFLQKSGLEKVSKMVVLRS